MKKTSILTLLSGFSCVTVVSAFNTGDQFAYTGSFYIGGESLRHSSTTIDSKIFDGTGLSGSLVYSDVDIDDDSEREYDGEFDQMTGTVVYVHQFKALSAGLSFSYVDSDLEADSTSANPGNLQTDADGWLVSVFAGKQWDKLSLSLKGTMGELSVNSSRVDVFSTKDSDYDSTLYSLEAVAVYQMIANEDWDVSPFAKLGYTSFESDKFEEVGANPNRLDIDQIEDDVPYVELGLHIAVNSFGDFTPYATLSVWQDIGDDEIELQTQDGVLRADIPDAAETVIRGKIGFDYALSENFALGASLGYFSGDDMDGMNAGLSAAWSF